MTSRFNRGDPEIARAPSTSTEEEQERPSRRGTSINTTGGADVLVDIDSQDQEPLLLPKLQVVSLLTVFTELTVFSKLYSTWA